MEKNVLLLLLLLLVVVTAAGVEAASKPRKREETEREARVRLARGLAPEDAARVLGAGVRTFVCDGGARVLPLAAVNDDYCDCADGTDEYGTAACAHGHFHCRTGTPQRVSSMLVNDGVCDCCDGSDEWAAPPRTCPNTCVSLPPPPLPPTEAATPAVPQQPAPAEGVAGAGLVLAAEDEGLRPWPAARLAVFSGAVSLLVCAAVLVAVTHTRFIRTRQQMQAQAQAQNQQQQSQWKDHIV